MRSALLAFAAGIAYVQTRSSLPAVLTCVIFGGVACVLAAMARAHARRCATVRRQLSRGILIAIAAALCGILWATWCARLHLADRLSPQWEGRDIAVVGVIDNLPSDSDTGRRFLFRVEQVLTKTASVPRNISLSWYARDAKARAALPALLPGARWRFTVRLKRPHGNANPAGFDYELWLFERDIGATGAIRAGHSAQPMLLQPFVFSLGSAVERMRGWLRQRIRNALPSATMPHAGVIVALVIGEQRAIGADDWNVFRRTGVSHLVAISGLHIMMVAGLFGTAATAAWRRSRRLPLYWPAQKAGMLAALLAAVAYVALAGYGVPAQRTLYMFAVMTLATCCGRGVGASHLLCLAMALVLLLDPWALLWPGFLLSFATVAILVYAGSGRVRTSMPPTAALPAPRWHPATRWRQFHRHFLRGGAEALRAQGAVTLGLLPLTMLLFSQYSLVGPAANALAIPVVTLLVAPLALVGAILPPPLSTPVLLAAHWCFSMLSVWLEWLSGLPLAIWRAPLPSWPLFLAALAGTLLMLAPRGWPWRAAGLCGWLPLLCNTAGHPAAGTMWVTAFDIGQGMAVLVETAQHRLLYDTGPPYGPASDAGERVILPYLQARGIGRLDAMVVSHADNDHAGGARSLLAALPVGAVYSSLPLTSAIVGMATRPVRCHAGQQWVWDGILFEMLFPPARLYDADAADGGKIHGSTNARSCVLRIGIAPVAVEEAKAGGFGSGGASDSAPTAAPKAAPDSHAAARTVARQPGPPPLAILLPGDIGVAQELALIRTLGAGRLRATVLLAPHHGSRTSSSPALLRAVNPALAIFQVGYRNRYRHPQAAVYRRYRNFGIRRLRTDETGAIALQFGAALEVDAYRQRNGRYWQQGGAAAVETTTKTR